MPFWAHVCCYWICSLMLVGRAPAAPADVPGTANVTRVNSPQHTLTVRCTIHLSSLGLASIFTITKSVPCRSAPSRKQSCGGRSAGYAPEAKARTRRTRRLVIHPRSNNYASAPHPETALMTALASTQASIHAHAHLRRPRRGRRLCARCRRQALPRTRVVGSTRQKRVRNGRL